MEFAKNATQRKRNGVEVGVVTTRAEIRAKRARLIAEIDEKARADGAAFADQLIAMGSVDSAIDVLQDRLGIGWSVPWFAGFHAHLIELARKRA